MKYRYLGKSGMPVSRLCLGTMTFGNRELGCDEAESARIVRYFYDHGGNFIDTADTYQKGGSETVLGQALQQIKRDDLVLATKCFFPTGIYPTAKGLSRKHIMEACEGSLKRLNTDYIDLYQIHGPDPVTDCEETCRALDDLVRQGKVRYLGCSNLYAWQIIKMNSVCDRLNLHRFSSGQYLYNLVIRDIEREIMPACEDQGMGVICWSPLAGGVLTGKFARSSAPEPGPSISYRTRTEFQRFWNERAFDVLDKVRILAERSNLTPSHIAIGWILKKQKVTSVIFGVRNLDQLKQNMELGTWDMPDDMVEELNQLALFDAGYPFFWIDEWTRKLFPLDKRHLEGQFDPKT